ncbi:hypothetical protein CEXT_516121 [Caerostris extrusa]|uniref:Uncharacterized protein n=1 Tax=Caerostris extrusa TaxID=172846 RepID=A0AAV4T7R2_CAEEX|nr:hypothetical protein CEXT_516121 [Caerostris extrusa]
MESRLNRIEPSTYYTPSQTQSNHYCRGWGKWEGGERMIAGAIVSAMKHDNDSCLGRFRKLENKTGKKEKKKKNLVPGRCIHPFVVTLRDL